jgi:hypothetical protein
MDRPFLRASVLSGRRVRRDHRYRLALMTATLALSGTRTRGTPSPLQRRAAPWQSPRVQGFAQALDRRATKPKSANSASTPRRLREKTLGLSSTRRKPRSMPPLREWGSHAFSRFSHRRRRRISTARSYWRFHVAITTESNEAAHSVDEGDQRKGVAVIQQQRGGPQP